MATNTTVISAERYEKFRQFLKDLWDYHELFWTFFHRELQVHYKQTALGVAWVVLPVILGTFAFSLIFGRMARMPADGLPYVLFYFAAIVSWNTFASAVTRASMSLEVNASLITKVYFPRVTLPASIMLGSMLDFFVGWLLLNALALYLKLWHWQLVAITPLCMVIQGCTALGFGLALSMINAQYRDVKHAIGFLVQLMMLATPVIYPFSKLPAWAQALSFLNPMAAVVTAFRDSLRGDAPFEWVLIGLSLVMALVYLCVGLWFFRRRELRLADIL